MINYILNWKLLENISNSYQTTSVCSVASAICSSPACLFETVHTKTTGNRSGLTRLTNTQTRTHTRTRHMQADRQMYRKKGGQESGLKSGQLDEEEKSGQKWRGHPAGLPQDERRRLESWPRWAWTPRLAALAFASEVRTVLIATFYNVTANT